MADRKYRLWLGALVLLGLALRLWQLDFQPLWWDEGYSVWFATHPLAQMAALTAEDIHPPLYYALLAGWIGLLGPGPISLRLLSVLFGVLAIPALYVAGRRFLGPRGGLLAAGLLAINPLHVYYSQEVRMYGLVALLSIGVLAAGRKLMEQIGKSANRPSSQSPEHLSTRSPEHVLPYILLAAAALYTQYYAVFLPIGLTIYAGWRWRRDLAALARWLAVQAAVALLYLPWVLYAAPKLTLYVAQKVVVEGDRPLDLWTYAARHLAAFLVGHLEGPLSGRWPLGLLIPLPLLIGLGLQFGRRPKGSRPSPDQQIIGIGYWGVPLLAALLLGWLIGLRYPFFPEHGERLLLLALPAFLLLLAAGLDALWSSAAAGRRIGRPLALATAALLVAASALSLAAFYTTPRYAGDDYRPLIARTVEGGLPEDTVFAIYPWQVGYWRAYGDRAGPTAQLTPAAAWTPEVAAELDAALARGKVWFPAHLALGAILETRVEDYLRSRATAFINEWYGPGTRLSGWASTPAAQEVPAPRVRFPLRGSAAAVELVAAAATQQPVPAANAIAAIELHWRVPPDATVLGVSVRLVDSIGQIWAQHDYEPLGRAECAGQHAVRSAGNAVDCVGLLIPAGVPAGQYFVDVTVRPKGDGRPLDVLAEDGRSLGTAVRLAGLTVAPADRVLGPERLPIGTRRPQDFADGIRLLGHTVDERPVAPGETRPVNLFWQATGRPTADYVAFVQLLDANGQVASGWEAPPGAAYATSAWPSGALIRTQATLRPRAELPDGRYPLIAGLFRSADKARLRTAASADHVVLGHITVRGRPHDFTPPQPQREADVLFAPAGRLIGYDLAAGAGDIRPGAAISLTLYWQATAATERPLTVFVHLVDERGEIRGYGDGEPAGGRLPTTSWLAGEYLTDPHMVSVDATAPAGAYRLRIGLYDAATGQRLLTPEGKDHVEVGPISVRGP